MTSVLRYAENKHDRDRFESKKGNARATWRLINEVSINKSCTFSEIVVGGKVVSDRLEIATKFDHIFY